MARNTRRDDAFNQSLDLAIVQTYIDDVLKWKTENTVTRADMMTTIIEPALKRLGLTKVETKDLRPREIARDVQQYFGLKSAVAIARGIIDRTRNDDDSLSTATLMPGSDRALLCAAKAYGIEVLAGPCQYSFNKGTIDPVLSKLRSGYMVATGTSFYYCTYQGRRVLLTAHDFDVQEHRPGWRWKFNVVWAESPKDAAPFIHSVSKCLDAQLTIERKGRILSADYEPVDLRAWQMEDLAFSPANKLDIGELVDAFDAWQSASCTVPHWGGVLVGKPGTGKTTVGGILVGRKTAGCTVIYLKAADFLNLPHGVNGQYVVRNVFEWAARLEPCLMIVDDIDLITPHRGHDYLDPLTNCFMECLDGLPKQSRLFFLTMTNRPEVVENALLNRPGRMGTRVYFPDSRECFGELLQSQARILGLRWTRQIDAFLQKHPPADVFSTQASVTPDLAANVMRRVVLYPERRLTPATLRRALAASARAFDPGHSDRLLQAAE